ncbi:MAG: single-stranded DNA-binding protein [Actinomycetota bacterium]|nr:single-stranded DNA-binding protein [Actinomycetota bacterium]
MHDLNRVQLIGHLGQDPEVMYTTTGTARTTFSVATSYHWKDADGQVQEATEWTRCVAWGILAEVCAQYVNKGSRVCVAGRLHTLRWQDAETDERHARVEIIYATIVGGRCPTDLGYPRHWDAAAILPRVQTPTSPVGAPCRPRVVGSVRTQTSVDRAGSHLATLAS